MCRRNTSRLGQLPSPLLRSERKEIEWRISEGRKNVKLTTNWFLVGALLSVLVPSIHCNCAIAQAPSWFNDLKTEVERNLAPSADTRANNIWIAYKHTESFDDCKHRTDPEEARGELMIKSCAACGGPGMTPQKQQNIKKLRDFQNQKCEFEARNAEKGFATQLARQFLYKLTDQALNSDLYRNFPLDAPITSEVNARDPYLYARLLGQFHVDKTPRYAAGDLTYCNVFAIDVTHNMHADLRNLVRDPSKPSVNAIAAGLREFGKHNGWFRVDPHVAQQMADQGKPTIALWPNPNTNVSGHIAMVRPGSEGDPRGVAIAQSGRHPDNASHLDKRFVVVVNQEEHKTKPLEPVEYWYHE